VRAQRRHQDEIPVPLDVLHHIAAQRRDGARNPRDLDVLHARLATAQEGVVGRDQLLALGFGRGVIARRIERGLLIRKHRGVYAVGHDAISDRGRAIAALLAVGDGTALSLEASAAHWGLPLSMPPYIDVVHPTRRPRNREGIRVHRRTAEITRHNGLLVTTIEQTLRDLDDERLTAEAQVMGLIPRGTHGVEPTRSEVERRFVRLVREAGLPQPLVNATIPPYEIDFLWPAERVVVETDGWTFHGDRSAFERDRRKDADLQAQGYAVTRVTWRAVTRDEMGVVARLAAVLAMRTPHRAPTHPPAGG
jgi:very-short-patch-repair endonuclease